MCTDGMLFISHQEKRGLSMARDDKEEEVQETDEKPAKKRGVMLKWIIIGVALPARTRISARIPASEDHSSVERERAQRHQSKPRPLPDGP